MKIAEIYSKIKVKYLNIPVRYMVHAAKKYLIARIAELKVMNTGLLNRPGQNQCLIRMLCLLWVVVHRVAVAALVSHKTTRLYLNILSGHLAGYHIAFGSHKEYHQKKGNGQTPEYNNSYASLLCYAGVHVIQNQ